MTYNIPRGKVRKFVAGEIEVSPDNSKTIHGLKVDAKGNVGIGTKTPTKKLDIVGDVKLSGILEGITSMALNSTLSSMSSQEVLRIRGTGDNFNTLVVMGKDETTEYVSHGINSSGWPTVAGGYVGSSGASRLAFATQAGDGASESIKMCIHPSGQLSLGATNIGSGEKFRMLGTGDNFNTFVVFGQDLDTEWIGMGIHNGVPTLSGGYVGTAEASSLAFMTQAGGGTGETEKMRITGDGDVLAGDYSGNARTWADVSFASHWGNWSSDYYSVSYRKDGMGNILLRGLIKCTNSSAGYTSSNPIFTLPTGYRPARRCIFHLAASHGGTRKTVEARVHSDGKFYLTADDPAANDWFSVDGIMFSIDPD